MWGPYDDLEKRAALAAGRPERVRQNLSPEATSCPRLCQPLWTFRVFGRFEDEEAKFGARQTLARYASESPGEDAAASPFILGLVLP